MKVMLRIALTLLALCAGLPALADPAPQWKLVQRVGEVWITSDKFQPVALSPNDSIPEKSVIVTGAKGRVILSRGYEQIILQPNTRLIIPETKGKTTRLEQSRGSALFRVERKTLPHFRVDTPYLAAVVKGTVFLVNVSDKAASVRVSEGAVSVASNKGAAVTLVKPGMFAEVKATNAVVINLTDDTGSTRSIVEPEREPGPATTERLDWGPPGGNDGGTSGGDDGAGSAAPEKDAQFQNLLLRDTLQPNADRRLIVLRSTHPETSIMEHFVDAATKRNMKRQEDKRVARFENIEHMVNSSVAATAALAERAGKLEIAASKNFLKNNRVKVDNRFTSNAIQNLIIGGVGLMIAYQLLKTLFSRKRR